jgi:carbamoyltransferase
MHILGLSAFYHDSAAVLVRDGAIVAAAQEERFTRKKHDRDFPRNAIAFCLAEGGIPLHDVDWVVFYEKPFLKFERLLETYLSYAPRGLRSFSAAIPIWIREKFFQRQLLEKELGQIDPDFDAQERLLFTEHHQSHAASAFYPSPFEEAVILTMDGVGEWTTTSAGIGRGNHVEIIREIPFPHSLGLLYTAFTYYLGFKVNSAEYKVMGLAPYGEPSYRRLITENLIDIKPDGSFRLNMDYFDYCTGLRMTNDRFHRLMGGPPRRPDEPLETRHMDLAASVQAVTEGAVLRLTRTLADETGIPNLCLAGGVALNCVANGKLLRDGRFRNVWVQPAAGDAGGALGAALAVYHLWAGGERQADGVHDTMRGSLLGPAFDQAEIERRLGEQGARFEVLEDDAFLDETVRLLADDRVVGWFQGRMEYGPRALGARSILGDPRSPRMQKTLTLKIKFRESFRPFAPSVLVEDVSEWFDLDRESPYMLMVADVAKRRLRELTPEEQSLRGLGKLGAHRSEIPAVTHVDNSARIQTVDAATDPRYHALISRFKEKTGCPVIVNTSFNVRGEPIVCTPEDAFHCLMGTEMDALAIGNCILRKEDQDPALRLDYKDAFELD